MTLLNIGLCRQTLALNWDQGSGTHWGKARERFGAIGRVGIKTFKLGVWVGGSVGASPLALPLPDSAL
jgi:hypothetical protein